MHKTAISVGVICWLGLMSGTASALVADGVSPDNGGRTNLPGVVCVKPDFDFGSIYSDVVVKHSYVLTNQGARVTKITGIHSSCGCATATAATNELAPGQTTTVDVVLDFKGRRGRQTKAIYAETDDPGNKVVRMTFTGAVMVPIEVKPEGIHFGTIDADRKLEREVLMLALSGQVFQVLSAKSAMPQISVTVEPREAGKQYLVKVACAGPRKQGSFMTSVEVETDHPQMKKLSIPVAGFVAGDIVAVPAVLTVVPTATNVTKSVWLTLWSPAGKPFKVVKVEMPGAGMTNSISMVRPDRCRVEIKTSGALDGVAGKAIRIETDLPSMKELLIPVSVVAASVENPVGK